MPSLPYVSLPSIVTTRAPALWGKMRSMCPEMRLSTPRGWRLSSVGKRPRLSTATDRHSTGNNRRRNNSRALPVASSPGSLLLQSSSDLNDYELLSVLGRGTFGLVRLARHRLTGRAVAIKILDKCDVQAMKQEVNILREQSVHLGLNHPFISQIYATFQDHDAVYFVLEYCPGGEVYALVYPSEDDELVGGQTDEDMNAATTDSSSEDDDVVSPGGGLTTTTTSNDRKSLGNTSLKRALTMASAYGGLSDHHVAFYMACIVSALSYLHDDQDVLYRDLKLENLVIGRDGYPKLVDFGLAKPEAATSNRNTTMCGSNEYIAPEIVMRRVYSHKVDLWALGVLMFELFFACTPFYHPNAREMSRKICEDDVVFPNQFEDDHPQACALMRSLLAKRPQDRPESAASLRSSAFFKTYFPTTKSWQRLEAKQTKAPFVPALSGPFDTSLFANAYEEDDEDAFEAY